MLALRVEYLTGRSVATAFNDRRRAEWPPHPARLFSALVAAWADADEQSQPERAALEWLEQQEPPAIHVSRADERRAVQVFVPVNDVAAAPERRTRQPRYFPSVTPHDPVVHFLWAAELPPSHRHALETLLSRMTRLGHSSSLVSCLLAAEAPSPNLVPDPAGEEILRTVAPGQVAALEREQAQHRGIEPRVLPGTFTRYRWLDGETMQPELPHSYFSADWIVLQRVGGPRLPSTCAVEVATAVRGALQKHADQPPSRMISGHEPTGAAIAGPHLAILPLPFVGHRHADGALLGVALVLPRDLELEDRKAVLRAVGRWEAAQRVEDEETPTLRVQLGSLGELELERIAWGEPDKSSLRPSTWCGPACAWMSVTPIALDRNPGDLFARDRAKAEAAFREAAAIAAAACTNIGLPLPAEVTILPSVTLPGTAKARAFPPFPAQEGRIRRVKVHSVVRFSELVAGPIVLGAGRFFGLGLMRPQDEEG